MAKNLLDVKDKKILSVLDMNARASYKQIGKDVGLSRKTVEYRIKNMEEKGIIKGYFPKVNFLKIGYRIYRIFIRLHNHGPKIEKEIVDFCLSKNNLYWFHSYGGQYDYGIGILARKNFEFLQFLEELCEKFGQDIMERQISEAIEIDFYSHSYLLNNSDMVSCKTSYTFEKLDKTDKEIINILSDDCKIPVVKIAKKLKISNTAISKRLEKLIAKNIIMCFRTQIDFIKLGYIYYKVFFTLKKPVSDKKKLKQFMRDQPNIVYATNPLGRYDIECEMVVEDPNQFHKVLKEIESKFQILKTNYTIAQSINKISNSMKLD